MNKDSDIKAANAFSQSLTDAMNVSQKYINLALAERDRWREQAEEMAVVLEQCKTRLESGDEVDKSSPLVTATSILIRETLWNFENFKRTLR